MNLKAFSSGKKGQLIICCAILGAVWLFLLIRFGASYFSDIPDAKKISAAKMELEKVRTEYEKAEAESKEASRVRRRYRELAASAWITSLDGVVETVLRRKIGDTADALKFKLNTIGSVRVGRINPEFVYADIDISGTGELADVIRFLADLAKIEPKLAWRRLDLRPDNRVRPSAGAGSANLAARLNTAPTTRLNFSGTLRVLGYEGKLTPAELKITRPGIVPAADGDDDKDDDDIPPAGAGETPKDRAEKEPGKAEEARR